MVCRSGCYSPTESGPDSRFNTLKILQNTFFCDTTEFLVVLKHQMLITKTKLVPVAVHPLCWLGQQITWPAIIITIIIIIIPPLPWPPNRTMITNSTRWQHWKPTTWCAKMSSFTFCRWTRTSWTFCPRKSRQSTFRTTSRCDPILLCDCWLYCMPSSSFYCLNASNNRPSIIIWWRHQRRQQQSKWRRLQHRDRSQSIISDANRSIRRRWLLMTSCPNRHAVRRWPAVSSKSRTGHVTRRKMKRRRRSQNWPPMSHPRAPFWSTVATKSPNRWNVSNTIDKVRIMQVCCLRR